MEECSVLIESILPAEDKTSRWFNLSIDYELFRDLLGVEADSGDYQIMDMKLPFAGDIVRTTSVRRLNKLCMTASVSLSHSPVRERFMRCRLQPKVQSEAYRNSQRIW